MYLVLKGLIVVDGVSFMVVDVVDDWFSVVFIFYIFEIMFLGDVGVGDEVNFEIDILVKYVEW